MRALITGIGGFAGRHLAALLARRNDRVFGLARGGEALGVEGAEEVAVGDVIDAAFVAETVRRFRPDAIFHLAAQSSVKTGENAAVSTFTVNTIGTLQMLEAVRGSGHRCRLLLASSAECYGRSATDRPLAESVPLRPVSIYAASKVAAETLVQRAHDADGADVVIARAFNHTGPGHSPRFVCADFARQIVAVERGVQAEISVGNLEAVRDFLDVRDVVRAYVELCEEGAAGEVYNICTGTGRKIADILKELISLSKVTPAIASDPARLRAAEVPVLVGDGGRLRRLGWQPEIAWSATLRDLLADQRRRQETQLS